MGVLLEAKAQEQKKKMVKITYIMKNLSGSEH